MKADKLFNHPGLPLDHTSLVDCDFPPQTSAGKRRILSYLLGQAHDALATFGTDLHGMYQPFITTTGGHLGIGHPGAAVGDKVVVLRGGAVPYILRECSQGHTLVGEWYVLY